LQCARRTVIQPHPSDAGARRSVHPSARDAQSISQTRLLQRARRAVQQRHSFSAARAGVYQPDPFAAACTTWRPSAAGSISSARGVLRGAAHGSHLAHRLLAFPACRTS
jgi:hypothetical protein